METNFTGTAHSPGERLEDFFERVFKSHFKGLHSYAGTLIRDLAPAEEIVQNVFLRWWEKKEEMEMPENITAYLYRCVHNESLNYLKHLKVRHAYQIHTMRRHTNDGESASEKVTLSELEQKLEQALRDLPEQCRTIFQLSRFEDLKYREIADRLDLSVKTVENQMGKALKLLRLKLVDFLAILILILIIFYKER